MRTPFHSDGSCKRPSTIAATLLCAISIFLDEKERAIVVKCLKMSAWRLKKRKKNDSDDGILAVLRCFSFQLKLTLL